MELTKEELQKNRKREYMAIYRQKNMEKIREQETKWRKNNPEKRKAQCSRYYENHKEICLAKSKKWVKDNPEKSRENSRKRSKRWGENHPEKVKQLNKKDAELLNDGYVIGRIIAKTNLTRAEIRKYPELIETKRLILKTQRLCKSQTS